MVAILEGVPGAGVAVPPARVAEQTSLWLSVPRIMRELAVEVLLDRWRGRLTATQIVRRQAQRRHAMQGV